MGKRSTRILGVFFETIPDEPGCFPGSESRHINTHTSQMRSPLGIDLSGLACHRASPRPDFGAQPAHTQQSYARVLLRLRELPADRSSADQRAALARVPTDGGQELPLNNTLIEVELE